MSRHRSQSLATAFRCICCCFLIGLLVIFGLTSSGLAAQDDQDVIQTQIDALTAQKNEVDEIISGLSGKPAQLLNFQKTLVTNYKNLAQQKLRLKGIRLWNGFVAFVSVAFDSLQKVNPGTSLVTNTATFLQDRAVETLPNPPLQAKIKRLSTEMNSLGPAMRQLDKALTMTPDEVAALMVSRGMAGDTTAISVRWDLDIRLRATPEAIANSPAVITGKTTFILERMDDAMRTLHRAKGATAESIVAITEHLENAKRKSRELGVLIAKLSGQIEIEKIREDAYEPVLIKEQPETSLNNVPPKAPSMAFMGIQSAWNDLKSNFITGATYEAVKKRMGYAANAYVHQQLKAESMELDQAHDYIFNVLPEIQKNTSDRYTKLEKQRRANERYRAASAAFSKKQDQQLKLKMEQFDKPLKKQLEEVEPSEIPRFEEFCTRMEGLKLNNPVTSSGLDGDLKVVTTTSFPGFSGGDSMAGIAWGFVSGKISQLRSTLKEANQTDHAKYLAFAKATEQKAEKLLSGANTTASQMQTILAQAKAMVSELEANRNLWRYLNGRVDTSGPGFSKYDAWESSMKIGPRMFELQASISRPAAQAEYELLKEDVARISLVNTTQVKRKQFVNQAKSLVTAWSQAKKLSSDINPDPQETSTSSFLQKNNLNNERIEKLKKVVSELDRSPKGLENYALREISRTSSQDQQVPNNEQLRALQEKYNQLKESHAAKQLTYNEQHANYQKAYTQLEDGLYSLQSVAPAMTASFSIETIMAEAGQQGSMSDWVLPEPDSMLTPDPADDSLINEFIKVATDFNQLLDTYRDKAEKRYTSAREKMAVLARKPMTTAVLQPDLTPAEFEARIAALVAEAESVYEPLAFLDTEQEKTDLGVKYQRLLDGISNSKEQYLMYWRLKIYQKIEGISAKLEGNATLPQEQKEAYQQELTALIAPGSFAGKRHQDPQISALIATIEELLDNLKNSPEISAGPSANEAIMTFYDDFSQAYEAKTESQVMSFIHDDWNAAGGVTLYDLEDNLRNMYNVFDDIQYSISGLSFSNAGNNIYNVRYSVTIRGVIYDNDLTHEEISAVTEQVIIDGSGRVKIYKTLGGNYWSIQ